MEASHSTQFAPLKEPPVLTKARAEYFEAYAAMNHPSAGMGVSDRIANFHRAWQRLEEVKLMLGRPTVTVTRPHVEGALS